MPLLNRIYISMRPSKTALFLLLSLLVFQVRSANIGTECKRTSMTNKHNKHLKPFDTLFCDGKPLAKYQSIKLGNDTIPTRVYRLLNDTQVLIRVRLVQIQQANKDNQSKLHFEFPNIKMAADYRSKGGRKEEQEVICKYALINQLGLDTLKSEMFATIYPVVHSIKKIDEEKRFIVERNKQAEIKIVEMDISQDGIFLGRIEEEELDGPKGKFIQYSIFNSTGALVCTASQIELNPEKTLLQWNLLTQKDMRFSSAFLKPENPLIELLKYLVSKEII